MEYKTALHKAQQICSRQEKCVFDILQKMQNWQVDESDQEKIIRLLKEENYIDEKRYTFSFVKDKLKFNHWGKVKIRYHLIQKHIDGGIIQIAIDNIDNELYNQILQKIAKDKIKQVKKTNDNSIVYKKTMAFLYNRGFGFEEADPVIRSLIYSTKN